MSQTAIGKGRIQKNSNEILVLTKGARSEGEYNKGGEKFLTWAISMSLIVIYPQYVSYCYLPFVCLIVIYPQYVSLLSTLSMCLMLVFIKSQRQVCLKFLLHIPCNFFFTKTLIKSYKYDGLISFYESLFRSIIYLVLRIMVF